MHAMMDHDYPGNVRELINIIERAFVLCHAERIELEHLPPALRSPVPARTGGAGIDGLAAARDGAPMTAPAGIAPRNLKPSERRALSMAGAAVGSVGSAGTAGTAGSAGTVGSVGSAGTAGTAGSAGTVGSVGAVGSVGSPPEDRLASVRASDRPEVQALVAMLDAHGWSRRDTADALGISRNTLWRRMRDYGLI